MEPNTLIKLVDEPPVPFDQLRVKYNGETGCAADSILGKHSHTSSQLATPNTPLSRASSAARFV